MQRGSFERAWQINEDDRRQRQQRNYVKHRGPRHLQHIWDGTPLGGRRVLVRCYHGLGDTIQFARFAAPLKRIAQEVIMWCQPELVSVISRVEGVDRVAALHDGAPDVTFDVDIESMELACALRASRAIIGCGPYVSPRWRKSPPDGALRVGLVWQAGDYSPERNLPAAALAPLGDLDAVELVSLQRGPAARDAVDIPARDASSASVEMLIQTIGRLDLVISIDTMVAHVAAAMGAPVWVLLARECDWRWPAEGRETWWYPTMRLFRQRRSGDWAGVVEEVKERLAAWTADQGTILVS
jgi:hypothetical protein